MSRGTIFDIKQMAIYDGPGIRTTVFFKGCPLRCKWCHNPEGLSFSPQLMVSDRGCTDCGSCKKVCSHRDDCISCGECVRACPMGLRRMAGTLWDAEELAAKLLKDKTILDMNEGGITFSGGEPTAQPNFLLEVLEKTSSLHRAIETCGHCPPKLFGQILETLDYIMMDIKLADPALHKHWTGVDNAWILANLEQLKSCKKPFVIRIPLIPQVTDTEENLTRIAELIGHPAHLVRVELLPYHRTAGAKYPMIGMSYDPGFRTEQEVQRNTKPFLDRGIPVVTL